MNETHKPAEDTNSLLLLWLGSASCAAALSFMAGIANVLRVVTRYLNNGELEGGKGFVIGMPLLFSTGVAVSGFAIAIPGLVHSLRRDRRPLFSAPHCIAFVSIVLPTSVFFVLRS